MGITRERKLQLEVRKLKEQQRVLIANNNTVLNMVSNSPIAKDRITQNNKVLEQLMPKTYKTIVNDKR